MKKVLVANRGEIAVRIIRACQELGLATVAVYSKVDAEALHTKIADQSVCIGEGSAAQSYLNIPAIIAAAEITKADSLHPGYGFLSEKIELVRACEENNICFIGPKAKHIQVFGDKVAARALAIENQVPLLPGSPGALESLEEAESFAREIGFPVIIKAASGGGGKGMKIVRAPHEFARLYNLARSEAQSSFGSDAVYVEKYIETPRHIEIQIVADQYGRTMHVGERECSIQRMHQKLIEEAPSPFLDESLRKQMGEAAIKLVESVGYQSVGTVEFLVDEAKNYYFMEVNPRIQVEHTVTEEVYGVDLVKEQIRLAAGEKLSLEEPVIRCAAMEFRINAEDPYKMIPWPGEITGVHQPGGPGVRIDSFIYQGYKVPSFYDSMIAKLICTGKNRQEVLERAKRALFEFKIDGIRTNIELHQKIIQDTNFVSGIISTKFLEQFLEKHFHT